MSNLTRWTAFVELAGANGSLWLPLPAAPAKVVERKAGPGALWRFSTLNMAALELPPCCTCCREAFARPEIAGNDRNGDEKRSSPWFPAPSVTCARALEAGGKGSCWTRNQDCGDTGEQRLRAVPRWTPCEGCCGFSPLFAAVFFPFLLGNVTLTIHEVWGLYKG